MIKNLLIGLMIVVLCGIGIQADGAVVSKIVGLVGECDTTNPGCSSIPLSITTLCTVNCPLRTSFSYTNSSRFWGSQGGGGAGLCTTSTDGGATWSDCISQAFPLGGGQEEYAGASDGSVIAVGIAAPGATCTIKRSTDNGANWGIVFTEAATDCRHGAFEGQQLYCLSDGRCEYINTLGGSSLRIFRSSDNGQNWVDTTVGAITATGQVGAAWDGSAGIIPSEQNGVGNQAGVGVGDIWSVSAGWAGTEGNCWGSLTYNGAGLAVCQSSGATPDGRYTTRTSVGTLVKSLTLPSALITSVDAGGVALGYATNVMYVVATLQAAAGIGVWVTRDDNTFTQIGNIGVGGAIRGGNAFKANGCIYITTSGGGVVRFAKIC